MVDKVHSDTGERIETITYTPQLQDSSDLETGTLTIIPTNRPAIASAQYSKSLTLPKPDDMRLEVKRIASRLTLGIAGMGTTTHVYLSVRIDQDDTDHELFNEDWISAGEKLDVLDVYSSNKSVIFELLKDGSAHTFYFLFWADVANQATVEVVQLWIGVGSCSTNENQSGCLLLEHSGDISDMVLFITQGVGMTIFRRQDAKENTSYFTKDTTNYGRRSMNSLLINQLDYNVSSTETNDLSYIHSIIINLKKTNKT